MLWEKKVLARFAAQEIPLLGVAEMQRRAGTLLAEKYHVCEIRVHGILARCFFAENAAGWKDGLDGAGDEAGWVEGQVSGVILKRDVKRFPMTLSIGGNLQ